MTQTQAAAATDTYTLQFCGGCLGEAVPNGTMLEIDLTRAPQPLDVVAVGLKADQNGPYACFVNSMDENGFIGVCKILLGVRQSASGDPIYLLAQLSPPAVTPMPAGAIVAIHPVMRESIPAIASGTLNPADLAALEMLLPFAAVDMTLQPGRAAA
ncbi:hypothetical protein [Mesorhizobium sp. IMUNJ 23232]|uniref:hypothetical protein n=1 Tax=Mesorhizobium sp. IMUNJ 23232 TaxID=3376064 RepID=UPI0037A00413